MSNLNRYVFVDSYYAAKEKQKAGTGGTIVYVVKAPSLEKAWVRFAHYAIPNFGLARNSSAADVKAHFEGYLDVYGPDSTQDLEYDSTLKSYYPE